MRYILGLWLVPSFVLNFFLSSSHSCAQIPREVITMAECEDSGGCATWIIQGDSGEAHWTVGAAAHLTVLNFGNSVNIQRVDVGGNSAGVTGDYSGERQGNTVKGTASLFFRGKKTTETKWHATIVHLPDGYDMSWRARGDSGNRADSHGVNLSGTWENDIEVNGVNHVLQMQVEQDGNQFSISVHDSHYRADGITFYVGKEGLNGVIHGQTALLNQDFEDGPVKWVPLDITVVNPDEISSSVSGLTQRISPPNFDDAPCDSENSSKTLPKYAYYRAWMANKAKKLELRHCWSHAAAMQGNASAQAQLGIEFHLGIGTKPNDQEAFRWAQKSALQNNVTGEQILAEMYRHGVGTPVDPVKAKQLDDKSAKQIAEANQRLAEARQKQAATQWERALDTPGAFGLTGREQLALAFGLAVSAGNEPSLQQQCREGTAYRADCRAGGFSGGK